MSWLQVTAHIAQHHAEAFEQRLLALGAVSVSFRDAEDEAVFQLDANSTPLWQQILASGLFDPDTDQDALARTLTDEFGLQTDKDLVLEALPDQDWERAWMADFKPLRFGKRLWICPSWSEPPEPDAVNLMLDPGLAFGSGTHPTTALCLEWLDSQPLGNRTVIDYGCGSGVLAIAAALLGAERVIAVDNDPQAVTACRNNRDLNGVNEDCLSVHLPGEHEAIEADILIANILSGPLQELMPVLTALIRPGGTLILSGILSRQSRDLLTHYTSEFHMSPPVVRDEWVRIEGIRRENHQRSEP